MHAVDRFHSCKDIFFLCFWCVCGAERQSKQLLYVHILRQMARSTYIYVGANLYIFAFYINIYILISNN